MKYLTTLEAAHQLGVSKQTLLNWLYAGKVPEPPRNGKGYRLWSEPRVALVRKLIAEGRIHKRTVVHRAANEGDFVKGYAREVRDYLREGGVDVADFVRELSRLPGGRHHAPPVPRGRRPVKTASRRKTPSRRRAT